MFHKKPKKDVVQSIYSVNTQTGAFIVEISLDYYNELFNGWDASAIKRKDLEPELLDYLEETGFEIPMKTPIEFCFYLPSALRDEEKEKRSVEGIRNNFRVQMHFIDKTLKRNSRKIMTYITMSIIFLLFAYLVPSDFDFFLVSSILVEGLFIGGWVLLWEAFSLFFFQSYEVKQRRKRYIKFIKSNIYFIYR